MHLTCQPPKSDALSLERLALEALCDWGPSCCKMYTQKPNSHVGLGEWGCCLGISSGMNVRRLDLPDVTELLDQSSDDLVPCENPR